MKNTFGNRLTMFDTSFGVLQDPARKTVWFQTDPLIFTDKVAAAGDALGKLKDFCQAQGILPVGYAWDKAREEKLLDDLAYVLARALFTWFTDQDDLAHAAQVDFTITDLRIMRDEDLLAKARLVRDLAGGLVAGAGAAQAAKYGINADAVQELDDEITLFAKYITAPQQAISDRKSLTLQLRKRFNDVEALFAQVDDMILKFNKTAAGMALIATYQAARIVRDYGTRHQPVAPTPAPTPA